jgi:hypothetical protein
MRIIKELFVIDKGSIKQIKITNIMKYYITIRNNEIIIYRCQG